MKKVCVSIAGLLFVIGLLLPTLARPQISAGAGAASSLTVDCENIWVRQDDPRNRFFYESNPTYIDPYDDTAEWDFSTPEEQGMDSEIVDMGLEWLSTTYGNLFSILIVRNDHLAVEEYFHGSARDHSNNVHSASKSMLSALVGIAIDQGYIEGLDQKISDIIPQYFVGASDLKKSITVRNMLQMEAGLDWTEDETEWDVARQPDWVQAILSRDLIHNPGDVFNYSTGLTHVMAAVIQKATGMSLCEFAHQYLFEPIGIVVEHWGRDPQAIYSGGYNLYMTPREMAKFGLLYLHEGKWNGQKIVPAAWVESSTQPSWVQYGQLWWLRTIRGYDMYFAWGYGGQFIYVIPELNIVWVSSQDTFFSPDEIPSGYFMRYYLIPSLKAIALDDFDSGGWSGGSSGWSGAWNHSGDAMVTARDAAPDDRHGRLRLRGNNGVAARQIDMSGVSNARLEFFWKARSFESGETATVEVYDGSWHTVLTVNNGDDDDQGHTADVDLFGYNMVSDFNVRIKSNMGNVSDYFFIDHVLITGD
jgi:CubicO group peptidase (beta-lactamase class C family)